MNLAGRATLALSALLLCLGARPLEARSFVFGRVPSPDGGMFPSSFVSPDGTDSDSYVYDSFVLEEDAFIGQVRWRGGYAFGGAYGAVNGFLITFYASTAGETQPLVTNPILPEVYLAHYVIDGDAGETPAGTFGGVAMYDYSVVLPTPFRAVDDLTYWIRIEAIQSGYPDWGIAAAAVEGGTHYRFQTKTMTFGFEPGDTAFSLLQ
jgi:hypothetical protein